MARLVGLVGQAGVGKDTAADVLVSAFGFTRLGFGAAIKDTVAAIFAWDREMLEGRTPESRAWREAVDPWWSKRLDMPHLTPRWAMQFVGTDLLRKQLHPDIWTAALERRIANHTKTGKSVVISDVRFPNEIALLRSLGGQIVVLKRGADIPDEGRHASEIAWKAGVLPEDPVLDNNGTVEELQAKLVAALGLAAGGAAKGE